MTTNSLQRIEILFIVTVVTYVLLFELSVWQHLFHTFNCTKKVIHTISKNFAFLIAILLLPLLYKLK